MVWPARTDARRCLLLAAILAGAVLIGFRSSPAHAITSCGTPQTYNVAWGNDESDGPASAGPDGKLSLREAIIAAESDGAASTINLPAGTYHADTTLPATSLNCGLTIQGAGARATTIDGGGHALIFDNSTEVLTIDGVTITGGHNTTDGAPTSGEGGALYNAGGTVTLTNDAIVGNTARFGGGVFNDTGASLAIRGSTFSGNSANGGTVAGNGGAIDNLGGATIRNATISGNSVVGFGGGIYTGSGHTTTLEFSTLDHNRATGPGVDGGDLAGSGDVSTWSNIYAGGSPNNCGAGASPSPPSSGNKDITTDDTCSGQKDDPKLGPLQNNGGPTDTEMLLPGSPAIDGAESAQCTSPPNAPPGGEVSVDQRGITREQGPGCDIGAYELVQGANLTLTGSAAPNPVVLGQNVTFNFTIASTGPAGDGTYPTLTFIVSGAYDFVSASPGCTLTMATVVCNPGLLLNGSSQNVSIVVKAHFCCDVTNWATVSSPRPDANAADNRVDFDVHETEPQLQPGPPAGPGGQQGGQQVGKILSQLLLSNSTFRSLPSGGPVSAARKKAPRGTTVSYTLTEPAKVTFTVQKPVIGHRSGKKCVAGKPNKKTPKKCTLYKRLRPSFTRQGTAGLNRFKFTGRLKSGAKGALAPGRYRLVGIATDAAGRRSKALTATFKIVR